MKQLVRNVSVLHSITIITISLEGGKMRRGRTSRRVLSDAIIQMYRQVWIQSSMQRLFVLHISAATGVGSRVCLREGVRLWVM